MFGREKEEELEHKYAFDISEFDEKEREEIERVKTLLEASEVIKIVARQSRIRPGGSLITPNIIFATNKRVIIKNPITLGLRSGIDSIPYSQINKVYIKKGALTSKLKLDIGQYASDNNRDEISAIPTKKATAIIAIINEHVRGAQNFVGTVSPPQNIEDPLKILKVRFAKGEITKDEYEYMISTINQSGIVKTQPRKKVEKKDEILLTVADSIPGAEGKGIARIDKVTMNVLGISEGEIIEIQGEWKSAAICRLLGDELGGQNFIRIDGLIQHNSGTKSGKTVTIRKTTSEKADRIIVTPIEKIPTIDERYLAEALDVVPVIKDDMVMVSYFGRRLVFQIIATKPEGIVQIRKDTYFVIEENQKLKQNQEETSENDLEDNQSLDAIKERYAKGVITREEFLQIKADLKDDTFEGKKEKEDGITTT